MRTDLNDYQTGEQKMPKYITFPTVVEACGNMPKKIEEYVGRVNTQEEHMSIARMVSPPGWKEPGQRPEFCETSIVLKGCLHAETEKETFTVSAGQALVTEAGEWVRYSTPGEEGAEYIAICTPAFSPESVHRDTAKGGLCGFTPQKN